MIRCAKFILQLLVGDNIWYQLFTGLLLREEDRELVDVILVDVLSTIKETSVIYTGLLKKFDIVRDTNELPYITLEDARSRDLRKEYLTTSTGQESRSSYSPRKGS